MWQKSGTGEVFWKDGAVCFPPLFGKSPLFLCGIETAAPWDEDWKESERLQTPKWIQNMVLHPDLHFSNNEPERGE